MKKEKALKLELINLLSDSKITIVDWNIENKIIEIPSNDDWKQYTSTGVAHLHITVYNSKNDRRIPTKK